jgi:hypothetical protein
LSNKSLILLIFIVLGLLTNGCIVKRGVIEQRNKSNLSSDELIKDVLQKNITNGSFYIKKAVVNFSDSLNNINLLISIKHNEQNKYLAIVRTLTGNELFRIFINRDTFLINDRLNKKILVGNEKYLGNNFGLDFRTLIYIFGDLSISKNCKSDQNSCVSGEMKFIDYFDDQKLDIKIDCNKEKISSVKIINEPGSIAVELEFNKIKETSFLTYPEEIKIRSNIREVKMSIKIKSIESPWNELVEFFPGSNYDMKILK